MEGTFEPLISGKVWVLANRRVQDAGCRHLCAAAILVLWRFHNCIETRKTSIKNFDARCMTSPGALQCFRGSFASLAVSHRMPRAQKRQGIISASDGNSGRKSTSGVHSQPMRFWSGKPPSLPVLLRTQIRTKTWTGTGSQFGILCRARLRTNKALWCSLHVSSVVSEAELARYVKPPAKECSRSRAKGKVRRQFEQNQTNSSAFAIKQHQTRS